MELNKIEEQIPGERNDIIEQDKNFDEKSIYDQNNENEYFHKGTSSTGKRVEKRSHITEELIGTWETIAKAADSEKICAAKMSRSIKNKILYNNEYYYCLSTK